MTREEANLEAKKIFQDWAKKTDEIMKKAKKDGVWKMGLDSNKGLFKEVNNEAKEKLRKLEAQIDE